MLNHLKELAVRRIESSYDAGRRLFCFRSVPVAGGIRNEGVSARYSLISLLGLYRLGLEGRATNIDLREATEGLLSRARGMQSIGDTGLLLWLCSLYCPEHLGRIADGPGLQGALDSCADARAAKTTELSWFLTGLSYAALASPGPIPGLDELAHTTYNLIRENYGGKGIFRHQNGRGLSGALRGRIGAFADQVYPVYGLSRYAQAYHDAEALEIAAQCGRKICSLQGGLGQWWWHYDAATGKVVGRYPVFSVHQYGMAPMALFALAEVSGENFDEEIYRGLDWISGNNELKVDMTDKALGVVWRNIQRPAGGRRLEVLASLVTGRGPGGEPRDLEVLRECRPYCFGWLLYAFAGKQGR